MSNRLIEALKGCNMPNTMEYLTIEDESPMVWDIEAMSELLPDIILASEENKELARHIVPLTWAIRHLTEIRNELKGGIA